MKKISTTFSFCGTKNKLIDWLKESINFDREEQIWVEPFCGSCGVGFNFRPKIAIFADSNPHLINFYNFLKNEKNSVKEIECSLIKHCQNMATDEKEYYYHIRERFNNSIEFNVFDFFFLAQCGFSHQLRYNCDGKLNMAYGKFNNIVNNNFNSIERLRIIKELIDNNFYQFVNAPYTDIIPKFTGMNNVFFYLDPPYPGTNQDYNSSTFTENDLTNLINMVDNTGSKFAMSGMCKLGEEDNIIKRYNNYQVKFKKSKFMVNSLKVTQTNEILVIKN